jgi:hypothetical protein
MKEVLLEKYLSKPADKDAIFTHRLALRARLLSYPPVSSPSAPASLKNDYVYEGLRLTYLIVLVLSDTCLPVQIALADTPPNSPASTTNSPTCLVAALGRAMRRTPLLTGWHDLIGCPS